MGKVITVKPNSFPGDNFIRLDYVDEHNRQIPIMGMWMVRSNGCRFYESDTVGRKFNTIKEAKEFAKKWHENKFGG